MVKPTAAAGEDKLRPCSISKDTKMPEDRLREKAVLTAVEAFQKNDDYFKRAQHIKQKFDAEEDGTWSAYIRHKDDKSTLYITHVHSNYIWFRVGICYIALWQSK